MQATLLLFAAARQRAGAPSLVLDLPEPATVADLKAALAAACPALASFLPSLRIAVDSEYAADDRAIPPGAELAAIPPVSGGSPLPSRIEIIDAPIDHAAVVESVRSHQAGAVCSFLGTVREMTGDRQTVALDYEAYPGMALKCLHDLDAEARRRWPIEGLALVHRVGRLELGEISVVVAVSCPHRHQAFDACRWLIDALKESVPIWKRETWADGTEEWVHPGVEPPAA